jgi:TRAP transporter TAXI family solute receptor
MPIKLSGERWEARMLRAALFLIAAVMAIAVPPAVAADVGTPDEAAAMVKRVQEKFGKDGPEATFKAITSKSSQPFHDRDLYAFIYDLGGLCVAHGAKEDLVGKNLIDFKDQDGKFVIREMAALAKGAGHGWVDYRWVNPTNKLIEEKSAYVEKIGDNFFVGVGVYRSDRVNDNTIAIISGSPDSDSTYLQTAYDLSRVLNDGDRLRILPIVGIGGSQNIRDVLNLKGVDIGITQSNILNEFRRSNAQLGKVDDKLRYVARLFNEETHLVARSEIASIEQLRGRKVNFGDAGGGTSFTMRNVFKILDINVEEVHASQAEAIEQLKRGEIAAIALVAGKPVRSIANLKATDGLHLVPVPYARAFDEDYFLASLTHDDYPGLIEPGKSVDTISVGAVLISYNWPKTNDRYRRVANFVEALFSKIGEFQKPPRHPKWREVNLASTLPGWTRFEPAEIWLNLSGNTGAQASAADFRAQFGSYLNSRGIASAESAAKTPEQREQLFQDFMKWNRARESH